MENRNIAIVPIKKKDMKRVNDEKKYEMIKLSATTGIWRKENSKTIPFIHVTKK